MLSTARRVFASPFLRHVRVVILTLGGLSQLGFFLNSHVLIPLLSRGPGAGLELNPVALLKVLVMLALGLGQLWLAVVTGRGDPRRWVAALSWILCALNALGVAAVAVLSYLFRGLNIH